MSATLLVLPPGAESVLVRTNMGHWAQPGNTNQTSYRTPSFTPANNSLLVVAVVVGNFGTNLSDVSVNDSRGLAWTPQVRIVGDNGYANEQIWTARLVTGRPMTVTVTDAVLTSEFVEYAVNSFHCTGYNAASPIGGWATGKSDTSFSGAVQINLNSMPSLGSETLALATVDDTSSGITAGTGWIQQYSNSNSTNFIFQSQTRTAS